MFAAQKTHSREQASKLYRKKGGHIEHSTFADMEIMDLQMRAQNEKYKK